MLVIFTGPDNTGKTTTVNKISEDLGIPIAPRYNPLPPNDGKSYLKWGVGIINEARTKHLVMDRGLIDEFVYGPILRGYTVFDFHGTEMMMDALCWPHILIVFCNPPIEVQMSTINDRPQLEGVKANAQVINNWFNHVLYVHPFKHARKIEYDFTKPGAYETLLETIKGELK